jgi:hypothetical protein
MRLNIGDGTRHDLEYDFGTIVILGRAASARRWISDVPSILSKRNLFSLTT